MSTIPFESRKFLKVIFSALRRVMRMLWDLFRFEIGEMMV